MTQAEGTAEAVTIITALMDRTWNAVVELRLIAAAKEIGRRLTLNIVNAVRMIGFVLCVTLVKSNKMVTLVQSYRLVRHWCCPLHLPVYFERRRLSDWT